MAPRPTRVRHEVVGVATLMAVLLYLDRNCLPLLASFVRQDLGLSDKQFGWAISAFYLTYALGQVPAGWMADRFGARRMLTFYILGWSLFTGLTGAALGVITFFLCRAGMGLGQAGAYPTSANIISKWVPFSGRGFASSVVSFGGRVGGSLAPPLTLFVIVALTPLSVSSQLQPGDVLDAPKVGAGTRPSPATDRIGSRLAALWKDKSTIAEAAQNDEALRDEVHGLLTRKDSLQLSLSDVEGLSAKHQALRILDLDRARLSPNEMERIDRLLREAARSEEAMRLELNTVIGRRDAFQPNDVEGLSLEKQAARLIARDRAQLSQLEVERLNRLILEATFPDAIRKVYGAGWRWVMYVYGAVGLAVAAAFWAVGRDRPADHLRVNEAELDLIRHGRPNEAAAADSLARDLPLGRIMASGSLWLSCISQCTTNFGWMFLVAWLPTYLERIYNTPVETRGWLVAIPFTVGWVGMLLGGRLTDWMVGACGLRWGRALPMALTRFLAMGAYIACLFDLPVWGAVVAFSIVAFATDLGTPAVWAFCQDVEGAHAGSVLGWGNMWGNLGAFITPPALIWIVQDGYAWDRAFLACAAAFLISGIAALAIDATVPVANEEK